MGYSELEKIKQSAFKEIGEVLDMKSLELWRIKYLGRKGKLTQVLRSLKSLSDSQKREIGPQANSLKKKLEELFTQKNQSFKTSHNQRSSFDISIPGKKITLGHLHPLTKTEQKIREIFLSMGFSIVTGPEIESEYYNFDALNIPPNHPARDMWNTFWLKTQINADQNADKRGNISVNQRKNPHKSALLLRTHTSPVQIRYMETHQPPFQIIVPGRVFRYEATDASHEINFYQVEGLMVGKDISLANFKFIIEEFLKKLFGNKVQFRFRPSYFPFVEPGLEVDIKINQKSKIKNQNLGWLEVMGAGMVHPRVFEAVHYNPRDWQGFAFGLGLERIAMIQYNIPDIRLFYSSDLRFIRQF